MRRRSPVAHKITDADITRTCNSRWVRVASAKTLDATQTKRLEVAVGSTLFRLSRRYEGETTWENVWQGSTRDEAIRRYNGMS